jgi:parallel beta-helix repeat protein
MKKTLMVRLGVCCIFFLFVIGVPCLSSAVPWGQSFSLNSVQILYVGGSGPGNYTKIQDAINNASEGDTVFVYDDSAPYFENIIINVSIYLIGENRNTTSIEGGNHAVSIYVDGVTVSGFRISNVGDFWNCCGFYIISQNNTISHNNIINNLRINGIFLDGASYNTISGNLIANNRYHGIRMEYGSHNRIEHNVIVNNRGYGIYLHESAENVLIGNTVKQSYFDGLMLGQNSGNNIIHHNNFIDNPLNNAYDTTGNVWDDGAYGNYWSDYTGSDDDGDGIGDCPYEIPGNVSQDKYPLMAPYDHQVPEIDIIIKGRLGLSISVKNTGLKDILYIDWDSRLTGGVLLLPSERSYQGSILFLAADEELEIQQFSILFGVGIIEVHVTVGTTTESLRGVLLLFVFIPLQG